MTQPLPSRESIQVRAYQLWEERGRPWGTPQVDWLAAEREMADAAGQDSEEHQSPTVVAAKLVGSVLGSVTGVVTSIIDSVQSGLESQES